MSGGGAGKENSQEVLERLAKTNDRLANQVDRLTFRNRIAIIGLVFDILLSIGLGIGLAQSHNTANIAHQEVIARCEAGNIQKSHEKELWQYIIDQAKKEPQTPKNEALIVSLQHQVDTAFANSDCQHTN